MQEKGIGSALSKPVLEIFNPNIEIPELNSTIMGKKIIRILLIQDNLADAQLIKNVLESKTPVNFELIHARELLNTLNDIDENNFDVILLDLSLPDIQEPDTLKQTLTDVPKIPVIVLTDKDGEVLGLKALRLGAQDYMVKEEITSNLLARSIINAIERKKFEEEIKQNYITIQNKLEIEIENSQKSDSLDAISGGVAHDLNNVFQLINLNLYLLEQKIPVGSPALEYLNKSNKILAHASELTKKILTLSQKKPIEFKQNNEIVEITSVNTINNSVITILLVEDNQNIRLVTTYFLESHNFKVFSACDGLEALEIFQEKKAEINLVFTDLVLPKKCGLKIYNEIIDNYPQMRFLFTSGYNTPSQETLDFIRNKRLNFIQKPYKPDALIEKIHDIFYEESMINPILTTD